MASRGSSAEPWPLPRCFPERLAEARAAASSSLRPCVLLTTGAMNPPHKGHAQLLRQAAERLQREGYCVLGAWMSPSHDDYVGPKAFRLGTLHLSSGLRLQLAHFMVREDDLVAVGSWEANVTGRWPDFPEVAAELEKQIQGRIEDPGSLGSMPRVFYACGTDHAKRCGLYQGFGRFGGEAENVGVVVVPREGEVAQPESPGKFVFVASAAPGDVASFSSTKIRESFKTAGPEEHQYLCHAICEEAADFILRPSAEQRAAYKEDFKKLEQQLIASDA
ncbi:Nicotinamide mononucleotide adenylyltransferase [Symbiodinium microadriaticum]|uniref:Nicotinamide mononucleotide adenylyltransferase n=2 Tax=Symbiodinium TaxID=2949 RepID=A0A1Q9DQT4_SYMMI|nr:Nicotinamide mononucleotide adenylyltransferase [Symbiodinium microadriaticum]